MWLEEKYQTVEMFQFLVTGYCSRCRNKSKQTNTKNRRVPKNSQRTMRPRKKSMTFIKLLTLAAKTTEFGPLSRRVPAIHTLNRLFYRLIKFSGIYLINNPLVI